MRELKKQLIENPEYIISILEHFEFTNIKLLRNEIRFSYGENHDATGIRIKLINNDGLFVQDFVRADNKGDLISYIIKARSAQFTEVMSCIKNTLGISSYAVKKNKVFGGFFDPIKNKSLYESKIYPETILNEYKGCNIKFLKDNISFETQQKFGIGFDIQSQRITIPIRNSYGELIGIKGRCNYEPEDNEPKYLYIVPCAMSTTLYGYSENYDSLMCADEIYIFEAEKSVMQAYDFRVRNCVALGSNNLSLNQIKLLYFLQPKRVIFMLDKGLDYSQTYNNRDSLLNFCRMNEIEVYMWDWKNSELPDKASPTDYGENEFLNCLLNIERI